ncbi:MAG: hypothetical protein Q9190_000459 [Brigantiaea leucoxantha]
MVSESRCSRQQLLDSLRGQELRIPNLQAFFDGWPQSINPNLSHLRKDVDDRLKRLATIATYKMKSNMLLISEMDSVEFSVLSSDLAAARQFRAATVEYALKSLIGGKTLESSASTASSIITSFKPIAEAISTAYSPGE